MRIFVGGDGRVRAGWRLLLQYLAYTLLATTVGILAISASPAAPLSPAGSPAVFAVVYVGSLGSALLTVWLAGRLLDRRPFRDFGLRAGRGWWVDFLFGLALGAVLMSLVFAAEAAFGWVSVEEVLRSGGANFLLGLLAPIVIFLCVGVSEELISRGYQLRNGAEGLAGMGMPPRAAVLLAWVLSSAFFGFLHAANPNANLFSTLNIVLAGLMLGAGYVLTGELAIPIGLHISWNLFQGNVFGFPVSGTGVGGSSVLGIEQGGPELWTGGDFGPEGGLVGIIAILLGCALTVAYVRLRHGRVRIETSLAVPPTRRAEAPAEGPSPSP